jgi:hypothetical protein
MTFDEDVEWMTRWKPGSIPGNQFRWQKSLRRKRRVAKKMNFQSLYEIEEIIEKWSLVTSAAFRIVGNVGLVV